ncbi:hypothetical protein V5799_021608 [Amblyomma americanum]|uniref:Uncharacterized protein n=1 Tax=Amblyomma americanum TaxID=6943 RepID=A0AAQ4FN02_AMBAM
MRTRHSRRFCFCPSNRHFVNTISIRWLIIFCVHSHVDVREACEALLSGTLKTFQKFACDGQELQLRCFRNTTISISVAQYGRSVPYDMLCPPPSAHVDSEEEGAARASRSHEFNGSVECIAKEALRVSVPYFLSTRLYPLCLVTAHSEDTV